MDDSFYMKMALEKAREAYRYDEVPVGCVIVYDNRVIASAYNKKEIENNPLYHAEVLAIMEASRILGTWHLEDCTLYTTIEPCMMCTGAIIQARISRVVYGSKNDSFGYLSKVNYDKISFLGGVLENECRCLMSDFFREKR